MLGSIALFFATQVGRYVFAGGVVVALIVSFAAHQRNIGRNQANAETQKTTGILVNKGKVAGNRSLTGSGGVQLPYRD